MPSNEELSRSFPLYFKTMVCSRIRIVPKSSSWLMKAINAFLWVSNKLGITNIQGFMTEYATTIHYTVYWPEAGAGMSLPPTPRVLHEFTHALQWHYRRLRYDFGYLMNHQRRAFYESVCEQTVMLTSPERATQASVVSRIPQFMNYGIPKSIVRQELNARLTEVQNRNPQVEAQVVADAWKEWRSRTR